jgi:hypothetical protein
MTNAPSGNAGNSITISFGGVESDNSERIEEDRSSDMQNKEMDSISVMTWSNSRSRE